MARRFGSAMISNTDSILFIYSAEHMLVKVYKELGTQATGSVGVRGCAGSGSADEGATAEAPIDFPDLKADCASESREYGCKDRWEKR